MKRAIVTIGMGFGDESKGATTDHLCRKLNSRLVIRYSGGSQCGHNVELPDGPRHTFSQFGAGTFAGADTYLASPVIIYPEALIREAVHLKNYITDPLSKVAVHPKCLVTTRLHRAANRLRELARGDDRHGSCGHGIGETRQYWLKYGNDAIFAEDLKKPNNLCNKLELLRQRLLIDLQSVLDLIFSDEEAVFDLLIEDIANDLKNAFILVKTMEDVPDYKIAIFEGAQGVLLDEYEGFHPHTTWSTVTARNAKELIAQSKHDKVVYMGITRGYLTRHGAGPLPTESKELTKTVNDQGNPWNEWQQNFRAGWLDLDLLHYANSVIGCKLDCIAVNCMDHLKKKTMISVRNNGLTPNNKRLSNSQQQNYYLESVVPKLKTCTPDDILNEIGKIAPIAIVGNGPTDQDRALTEYGLKNLNWY